MENEQTENEFCESAAIDGINFVAENRFEDMVTKHIKSANLINTMESLERAAASMAFAQQWIERTIGVLSARVIIGAAVGNDEITEGDEERYVLIPREALR